VLVEDAKRRDGDDPVSAQVTIWSERAEELAGKIQKGHELYVEGKVKPAAWTSADGTVKCSLDVSAWKAEPLGQIGRSASRRPQQDDQPSRPRAMPQQMALVGTRNTRQQFGLDDDLDGWPA
jgi:single-stranded DNA-binding protein